MATIITRLYENEDIAAGVTAKLDESYFTAGRDYDLITQAGDGTARDRIEAAGVTREAATTYAARVEQGAALLVVRAVFGSASEARAIADTAASVNVDLPGEIYVATSRDRSVYSGKKYFLSNEDRPPLLRNSTPFSSAFSIKLLARRSGRKSVMSGNKKIMPFPTLSNFSMGGGLIRDRPTWFSTLLGWKTLSEKEDRPLSIDRDNPTPFSSALNWPTLSKD